MIFKHTSLVEDHKPDEKMSRNMERTIKIPFVFYLIFLFSSITAVAQSTEVDTADYLSPLEKAIVSEINIARTNPKGYASFLEKWKQYYDGKQLKLPGEISIMTREGVIAVNQAIRSIRSMNPVLPLSPSKGMSWGAKDHVKDQGSSGSSQHKGNDGSQPWDRVNRYGVWQKAIGENISYGSDKARNIVIGLIIDDGVPGRGHRKNIFNPDFRVIGVAFGHHATYRTICVITFAGGYIEKTGSRKLRQNHLFQSLHSGLKGGKLLFQIRIRELYHRTQFVLNFRKTSSDLSI
jgi:uncharacterized protein YkwD